ncbi:anaphase-promoting complex subunit 10-like [Macrobrachium nipponense]|uniref:anaphase-promoting complex subunit 10-like n=1 Tax=Macrobrachium nipponense TaxID=159736 RepID=UPI0030C8D44A
MTSVSSADHIVDEDFNPDKEERREFAKDVGDQAHWSASTFARKHSVENLRDGYSHTYWESSGPLPHTISLGFWKQTTIQSVWIYVDYFKDKHYAPKRISIQVGTFVGELKQIVLMDLQQHSGWQKIPLRDSHGKPVKTYVLEIAVLLNKDVGEDSRIRQIRVHSPPGDEDLKED